MMKAISRMGQDPTDAPGGKWKWYHGVLFYIVAQVFSFGLKGLVTISRDDYRKSLPEAVAIDNSIYKKQKQPVFAPPPWLFGPAWTINNISVIYGNLRALNLPQDAPGRAAFLKLQALSWLQYVLFSAAYFGLRSPINGMVVTLTMFWLTIASMFVALFRLKDSRIALSLATLLAWLSLASALSVTISAWNRDAFYKAGPFAEPVDALLKK